MIAMATDTTTIVTPLADEVYKDNRLHVQREDTPAHGYSGVYNVIVAYIDGRNYQGLRELAPASPEAIATTVAKLLDRAHRVVDGWEEDARIYPTLVANVGLNQAWTPDGRIAQVGDIVVLFSRGASRRGLVTKVTRTGTATVAYVTPGGLAEAEKYGYAGAQITRKTAKVNEYQVVSR